MKPHYINYVIFAVAVCAYGIHTSRYIANGHWENLLWACHLGILLIGSGFLFSSSTMVGMGFFWGIMGLLLWTLDLVAGGEFIPTSLLTHLGGPCLGIYGIKRLGIQRGTWWKTMLAFFVLQQVCRFVTPYQENVNVAHFVWSGWQQCFPSYFWYMVMLYAVGSGLFYGIEQTVLYIANHCKTSQNYE